MGAKNCPATFQRMMNECFRQMPPSSLVIYLDDIVCHSRSMEEHLSKLEELSALLRKHNLHIRADKTVLTTNEVNFCGYRVKDGTKFLNCDKVKTVQSLKIPTSAKEAQQIFGLLNYHRQFIPHFAKTAAPITKTYNSKKRFSWPR